MNGQLVLIDGYNIIRQWQELGFLPPGEDDYASLRDQLINHLCSCFSYWGAQCWLVFDAHLVAGGRGSTEFHGDCLQVIYTKEGQDADSFIERAVAELQSSGTRVTVCTSDWAEQNIVLTRGAHRLSARDLLQRVRQAEADMSRLANNPGSWQKIWLEDSLPDQVQEKLRQLRDNSPGPKEKAKKNVKKNVKKRKNER